MGPWNWKGFTRVLPLPGVTRIWSMCWEPMKSRLSQLNSILEQSQISRNCGWRLLTLWDLSIPGACSGQSAYLPWSRSMKRGNSCADFGVAQTSMGALVMLFGVITLAGCAILDHAAVAGAALLFMSGALGFLIYWDCARCDGSLAGRC